MLPSIADKKSTVSAFVLERTSRRMKQFFQERLTAAQTDITIDQWVVLQELQKRDGQSQMEIARATYKDAATLTRIIDLLCKKELTRRIADPTDRRRFNVYLTPGGHEKIANVLPIIRQCRSQAWAGLSDEAVDQLVETLNDIYDNLTEPS